MAGPLADVTVLEIAGIGPGPFCGMMLADMGARVIRVDRADAVTEPPDPRARHEILNRGRQSIAVDLKHPEGVATVLRLAETADAMFEGFRPGVAERLGIGPKDCHARNPALVYGRMTGWGQDGPYAQQAGHDITYLAVAGALHPIGRDSGGPVPPLNVVGDFGGGGMLLAFGIVCALLEARTSGKGQVIDAAIVDGAAVLTAMMHGMLADGRWSTRRGENLLDSGCPYYDVYRCADGEYVAVGALEDKFFAELVDGLGVSDDPVFGPGRTDPSRWPAIRRRLTEIFASATRQEWAARFGSGDACVAPVLSLTEASGDVHNQRRVVFDETAGFVQPNPAPRFDRTPAGQVGVAPYPGEHTTAVLAAAGYADADIERLERLGAVRGVGARR
ncbi:CaiB/BaiF CoA-transferase family protein [Amycolatopsis sp. NPDC006131]|uniref:CaiB/BaiF CoA transferase family protein n=1 Tax=Amycolatopsis sp. NPDC006131 TaxID=3156731 RepID=UPI0033AD79AC